jgi:tRNA (mo5U34)-methyltransferase
VIHVAGAPDEHGSVRQDKSAGDVARMRDLVHARPWYHVMELAPGVVTPGAYDPRQQLVRMGFPLDLSDKTVLDIGTYDGFFAFEAERRGARSVLAIDQHPADHCGFALARDMLGSRVEYRVASVYDLAPETFGFFDVVLFPGVFYHLRHPLLALDRIHSVCREYVFLETHVLDNAFLGNDRRLTLDELHPALSASALLQFYPYRELNGDPSNWFAPTVRCVELMLHNAGFQPTLAGRWGDRASFVAHREEFVHPFWY